MEDMCSAVLRPLTLPLNPPGRPGQSGTANKTRISSTSTHCTVAEKFLTSPTLVSHTLPFFFLFPLSILFLCFFFPKLSLFKHSAQRGLKELHVLPGQLSKSHPQRLVFPAWGNNKMSPIAKAGMCFCVCMCVKHSLIPVFHKLLPGLSVVGGLWLRMF